MSEDVAESVLKAAMKAAIDQGLLGITAKIGAFVSSIGALVGLAGGILGVRSIRKPVAHPAMGASVPPPPPAP